MSAAAPDPAVPAAWMRVAVTVAAGEAEILGELLESAGAVAVTMTDAGDEPLYEPPPGEAPLWRSVRVEGLVEGAGGVAAAEAALAGRPGGPALSVRPLPERDWQRDCQQRFGPRCFGERLWVVPTWSEPPPGAEACLRLDPGLAFGTGEHPSTALCLEWLAGAPLAGHRVLDYGCGSGVLALAALALGAAEVRAVDIDPQARRATRDNAALNGCVARLWVGEPAALGAYRADVVVANILADTLADLAPGISAHVADGGSLALAGILDEQCARVAAAYPPDLVFAPPRRTGGWALLSARRAETAP